MRNKLNFPVIGASLLALFHLSTLSGYSAEEKKPQAEPITIGTTAPNVTTLDQDGKPVNLAEYYKKGYTLVYFYPKADTGGCTAQACSLRDQYAKLTEKGIQVIGVSVDSPAAQKAFRQKYNLPFTLIPDTDHKVINAFGVPLGTKKPYAARQAFLIKDGVVVWRDLKASTKEQAETVLKAVDTLSPKPAEKPVEDTRSNPFAPASEPAPNPSPSK
jgi:thioredoxin-dependent peroxiredoxin